jgi:hypothetical protein
MHSTPPSDTDPEAGRIQIELLRAAPPGRRAQMALDLSALVIALARRGLRGTLPPGATDEEAALLFVRLHYGSEIADGLRRRLAPRPR